MVSQNESSDPKGVLTARRYAATIRAIRETSSFLGDASVLPNGIDGIAGSQQSRLLGLSGRFSQVVQIFPSGTEREESELGLVI
jgi:hypothetical protein